MKSNMKLNFLFASVIIKQVQIIVSFKNVSLHLFIVQQSYFQLTHILSCIELYIYLVIYALQQYNNGNGGVSQ